MAEEMKLTSTAFEDGGWIPETYTCAGENINPPLQISGVPSGAKSLVLLMEDPDVNPKLAKDDVWYHWVIFNLRSTRKLIREGEEPNATAGEGSSNNMEYYGPCPPPPEGPHRYYFRLYALDTKLNLEEGAMGPEVKAAMEGHILAETALMAKAERGGRESQDEDNE